MIIGYSVLYINDDTTVKDVLWERRVVHSTWEKALVVAELRAYKEKDGCDEYYLISVLNSTSKESCDKYSDTIVYTINSKGIGEVGNIYIVPVFDE